MEISNELIAHIAHLSRLTFEGEDKIKIKSDLEKIISFVGKLDELNTEGLEPLIFMSDEINVLREDIAVHSIDHEQALLNAPKKDTDYFRIPKVLSK